MTRKKSPMWTMSELIAKGGIPIAAVIALRRLEAITGIKASSSRTREQCDNYGLQLVDGGHVGNGNVLYVNERQLQSLEEKLKRERLDWSAQSKIEPPKNENCEFSASLVNRRMDRLEGILNQVLSENIRATKISLDNQGRLLSMLDLQMASNSLLRLLLDAWGVGQGQTTQETAND